MQFLNRHQELARLRKLSHSKTASLGVVWGRRRIGKTRLLIEWAEESQGIYYMADESSAAIQRKFMAIALEPALPGFSNVEYPDWQSFFARLAADAKHQNWRGPLVIDELPYLFAETPELPSILQRFVDHDAKKSDLILVFSGSSQHMMQESILEQSAPLYGRADEILKLSPIQIGYLRSLHLQTEREIIEFYSVFGGIPKYWELSERISGNLSDKIDQLVLDPMGPLSEEPNRLLREESPSAMRLKPILDAIGLGNHRLSEIASRLETPITGLTRPIEKLLQLELIQREVPYGADYQNSKQTLYKIKDPFLRFWFRVIAPRRSLLAHASSKIRRQWLKENLPSVVSRTWEELCRAALPKLSESWDILYEPAGRFWQGKEYEWDIVSQSYDGKSLLIGEAKWTQKTPTKSWIEKCIEELQAKGIPPVKRSPNVKIEYALFLPEIPEGIRLPENVRLVGAGDSIKALV